MDELITARCHISEIDKKIAELFEQRMTQVNHIAEYKKIRSLPVYDPKREAELIQKNSEYIRNPEIREYYIMLQKDIMNFSRLYQHRLLSGMNAAYSGVDGAFTSIETENIFSEGEGILYPDFKSAYDAVISGECDSVALPVENNFAGEFGQVIDLIFSGNLYVTDIYEVSVYQNTRGIPCSETSDKNTAETNTMKFATLSRSLPQISEDKGYISLIMFTVNNEAGALAEAISVIGRHGYNMTTLRSRYGKNLPKNYYFYAELNGNICSDCEKKMINDMKEVCSSFKLAGVYSADRQI